MLRPKYNIQIGNIAFDYVTELGIESSWEEFTDKVTLTLPNKLKFQGQAIVNNKTPLGESVFKRGDAVTITIGYFPNQVVRFTGFVSKIKPQSPLIIEAQDAMWKLKQLSHTLSFKQQKLRSLIDTITKDSSGNQVIPFEVIDTTLGPFRISNASSAQILDKLKADPYSFFSYIRDGVLKVGLAFTAGAGKEQSFDFQRNIIDGSNLEFLRADDVKITVKAVNINRANVQSERFIFFDNDGNITSTAKDPKVGETRTLFFYNTPISDIIEAAKRKLPELIYEGYRGSFLTFGEPVVQHGDIAVLKDRRFPERDGSYLIRRVNVTAGINGYRQEITLDAKVS